MRQARHGRFPRGQRTCVQGRFRTLSQRVLAALLLGSLFANSSPALPIGQVLSFAGGASIPMQPGNVDESWNTGFAVSGAFLLRAAPTLELGVEVSYLQHPLDSATFEESIASEFPNVSFAGRSLWVVPIAAIGELDLLTWGVVKPYLRAGFGVYKLGTTDFTASGPKANELEKKVAESSQTQVLDDTVFGTLIGVGVRTPITPAITLTLDATYHVANTVGESTHFLPVRLGLQF